MSSLPRKKRRARIFRQLAALPYRVVEGRLFVLLVTSRETGRWVIPKGWPETGMKAPQVATMEAFEEAGIVGECAEKPIASFRYAKRMSPTKQRQCKVDVFLFVVHRELDEWPEKNQRKRQWMTPQEAAERVAERGLQKLLLKVRLEQSTETMASPHQA